MVVLQKSREQRLCLREFHNSRSCLEVLSCISQSTLGSFPIKQDTRDCLCQTSGIDFIILFTVEQSFPYLSMSFLSTGKGGFGEAFWEDFVSLWGERGVFADMFHTGARWLEGEGEPTHCWEMCRLRNQILLQLWRLTWCMLVTVTVIFADMTLPCEQSSLLVQFWVL